MSDPNTQTGTSRECNRELESSSDDSLIENPRRRNKKVITDSDSDSSVENRKRRRLQVVSDSSESSEYDIVRRKPKYTKLDSDFYSSSEWETDHESKTISQPSTSQDAHIESSESSDSNDGQSEKCPICLLKFKSQEVGTPESCDHCFCAVCIIEWSKSVNTCPIDRKKFNTVIVKSSYEGSFVRKVCIGDSAANHDFNNEITEEDLDYTPCQVCGLTTNEDRLLLCDGCDLAYHLECLTPPLDEVPEGQWFCVQCEMDEIGPVEEVARIEVILNPYGRRQANRAAARLIPRTRQTERIRTRIVHQRLQNVYDDSDDSDSDISEDRNVNRNRSQTRRPVKKPKATKRKYKRKKRKVSTRYKIVYEINEKTGEKVAVRKKKRIYRKKRRSKKKLQRIKRHIEASDPRRRLASQLGIRPPKKGHCLPEMKVRVSSNDIAPRRNQGAAPSLRLFGQRDELDYFSGSDVEYEAGSSVNICIARRPNISDAAVLRRNAGKRAIILGSQTTTSTSIDILGSILEAQTELHSKSSIMSVTSDGTVKMNPTKKTPNPLHDNGASHTRQAPTYPNNTTTSGGNSGGYYTYSSSNQDCYQPENPATTSTEYSASGTDTNTYNRDNPEENNPEDYSLNTYGSYEPDKEPEDKKDKPESDRQTPITNSDSELDIYGDIDLATTGKYEEPEASGPILSTNIPQIPDEENNESDTDLIIDTDKHESEKYDPSAIFDSDEDDNQQKDDITSTSESLNTSKEPISTVDHESPSALAYSPNEPFQDDIDEAEEPEDDCPNFNIYSSASINMAKASSEDDCPNFNIYSSESINMAKTSSELQTYSPPEETPEEISPEVGEITRSVDDTIPSPKLTKNHSTLYSDSEDEGFMKLSSQKPFGIGDIQSMTEDISEEERSYTPCLDEKEQSGREGLEGLDTEMVSDEDKNDFEETPDLEDEQDGQQTIQDADALEINAKESELDFTKPDDGEDCETSNKPKSLDLDEELGDADDTIQSPPGAVDSDGEQESESLFRKFNNKTRNYREMEKERSLSIEKQSNTKDKRKEKRKRTDMALYDVRSVVESRPKRDKFGRDPTIRMGSVSSTRSLTPPTTFGRDQVPSPRFSKSPTPIRTAGREMRHRSVSISSRSRTPPPQPPLRGRKSHSPISIRKNKEKSRSASKSRGRKRSRSRPRKRGTDGSKDKRKPKVVKSKTGKGGRSNRRRSRVRSPPMYRRQPWENMHSKGWSRSLSRSPTPDYLQRTPSWTPPRNTDSGRPENLTVSLPNRSNKKRKEKRKRSDKRPPDNRSNKRRRRRSPRPAKEVFTSGSNILVSVSFNKENEERSRRLAGQPVTRRVIRENGHHEKDKSPERRRNRRVTNIKPVAIIDLERSPFRVITPPNDVIVLTDSDTGDHNELQNSHREATPQAASPEPSANNSYVNLTGPKTPPEPQVKFTFSAKQTQLRAITNPLLDGDDPDEIDPQEELENRLNEVMHKGPNTPPEPPNSPPSSPDAYDPFEPTKSRSPTPVPVHHSSTINQSADDTREEINETVTIDLSEKGASPTLTSGRSHTPPLSSSTLQPADSQNSIAATTPDTSEVISPEKSISVIINQIVQPPVISKAIQPTFSSNSMVTSTPVAPNLATSRINILNSTVIPQPPVLTSLPRIILPALTKSSPVNKVSPSKSAIKPTPIKPMPAKNMAKLPIPMIKGAVRKPKPKTVEILNFESPYSPGENDYDDLFEPPVDAVKPTKTVPGKNTKAGAKQNTFDALFGSSPNYSKNKSKKTPQKHGRTGKATKLVGVKLDEDNLKILDDLPNSAVELQVKDKFLKKLNRQERVVEEVKIVLKPYYNKKRVNKEEYKEILRRAVPKICHNKSGEINPSKIQRLIQAYVRKLKRNKKVTSSSNVHSQNTHSQNPQNASQTSHPQKTEAVSNWLSKLS